MTTGHPRLSPLYAAGFVTAAGAHSVAAGFGANTENAGLTLLTLGIFLAVYDLAEVLLKPLFGTLSDRIGPKPVIVGGLIGFTVASLLGIWAAGPVALAAVRFAQGAAASAFSPASSASVSRLTAPGQAGRYFGRYGSWKGLGYAAGPILGAALIAWGGTGWLFGALALVSAGTAVAVAALLPTIPPLPRVRYTVMDLVRQVTDRDFLLPAVALAAAAGALGTATGLLPALGRQVGLNVFGATAAVTVLAVASAVTQPLVGRLRDAGRLGVRAGVVVGLALITVALLAAALVPSAITVFVAGAALGVGIGTATPLAFTHLSATTPPDRIGRTMGTAELGRETGDAAGPLLVGGVAAAASLPVGLLALSLASAVAMTAALFLRSGPSLEPASDAANDGG
ncbi:MAG: major facilitator superfamily 1 [Naasia sp.]|jgi:MFS family permease|uniref:MFS transporter n=1 Tax=Naasia sp. TaxID=2546198 RepID=UPI0026191DB8|nr:MFS transporter [Naasia sp.]MCU1569349.1 major facilitator superfamily 1 [Naasia sp.]